MADKTLFNFGRIITLPKTGETTSQVDYDDGYYQKGSKVNPRFVDNGNGTITDRATGLMWVKQPELIIPGASVIASNQIQAFLEDWVTETEYAIGDVISLNASDVGPYYICIKAHTSGTFATDLSSGDWILSIWTGSAVDSTHLTKYWEGPDNWNTEQLYTIGTILFDVADNRIWTCLVEHTSGLVDFATDRTAHPTYWVLAGSIFKDCEGLIYAGYSDWRLPNINELYSIFQKGSDDYNAIDPTFFPNAGTGYFWSSTYNPDQSKGYVVSANTSIISIQGLATAYSIYPVRG